MPNHEGFYTLAELRWPVTYSWRLSVPWGFADLELTLEIPAFENQVDVTRFQTEKFFTACIAPAMCLSTILLQGTCYLWKLGLTAGGAGVYPSGQNFAIPLGPERGIVAVMMSGHTDRWGKRRLYFPACPRTWVDGIGQVKPNGAGKMRELLAGMFGGLNGTIENAPIAWLNYFTNAIRDPITGFYQPAFRSVEYVRLCQYTAPVPVAL